MKKIILFLALCVGMPMLLVHCMESANSAESIIVENAYSYPSIGGLNVAAAFLEIKNDSDTADTLVGAEAEVSDRVELHTHVAERGLMRMRQIEEIPLPAGEKVALQRGGLHIMLFNLIKPLKNGDTFPLTLKLKSGNTIPVTVKVESRD